MLFMCQHFVTLPIVLMLRFAIWPMGSATIDGERIGLVRPTPIMDEEKVDLILERTLNERGNY